MPGCTIEGTYEATIMSYCWGPTFGNVDYDNPFHREVATNILENLCNWQSTCYDPPQCPDNDLDGVCNAIDCAIDNPALPGIVGNSCSDGNPLTVNDTLVLDPDRDDNLSCTCQGTPWVNPAGAECDLIIGGMLDFDQDIVGTAEGTWYGGLNTGWTISPNNTPDIGHEDSPMDCNKFISFEGLYDHTNNNVSIKEGIAIELSHPIPCDVGRFQLSFNYSYVEKGGGLLTGNLVSVQGTNALQNNMPHECNGTGGTFVCLGTVAPANQCDFNGTWGNLTKPADCTENITFCEVNEIITNQSDQDLNFIYLSFDVNSGFPVDQQASLFLDNISITMIDTSYAQVTTSMDSCQLESITYSDYCEYRLQFKGPDSTWTTIPEDDLSVMNSISSTTISGYKITEDIINYDIDDCHSYRVVQVCPPYDINGGCGISSDTLDLSNCDNSIPVSLISTADDRGDTLCLGEMAIIYDENQIPYEGIWSTGDTTTRVQLDSITQDTAGTFTYIVTVSDPDTGCMGQDSIDLTFVECPPPMIMACGTTVNFLIDLNINNSMRFWLDSIPHTFDTNNIPVINDLIFHVVEDTTLIQNSTLEMDVDINFNGCLLLLDSRIEIEVQNELIAIGTTFSPCDFLWHGITVNQGGSVDFDGCEISFAAEGVKLNDGNTTSIFLNTTFNGRLPGCGGPSASQYEGIVYGSETIVDVNHCTFNNLGRAVVPESFASTKSDITIKRSHFNQFSRAILNSRESTCSITRTTFSGTGCDYAIRSNGINLSMVRCKLQGTRQGVDCRSGDLNISLSRIETSDECVNVNQGENINLVSDTLISLGSFSSNPFFPGNQFPDPGVAMINQGSSFSAIRNSIITRNVLGSAISTTGGRLIMTDNECTGGGYDPRVSRMIFPVVYNAGLRPRMEILRNVITSEHGGHGLLNANCPSAIIECNDISVPPMQNSFQVSSPAALFSGVDCNSATLMGNDLFSDTDLLTLSTISNPFHEQNCFNGARVDGTAVNINLLLANRFFVNSQQEECFMPDEVNPTGWFVEDTTVFFPDPCLIQALPEGHEFSPCDYLTYLTENDSDTHSGVQLMSLISLYREYEDQDSFPLCLEFYLDGTEIEGLQDLVDMKLMMDQVDKASSMAQSEALWNTISGQQIPIAADSIIIIEMKAIQLLDPDRILTAQEQAEVQYLARKCSSIYGNGIHLMRVLASASHKEDYRIYDLDCDSPAEYVPDEARIKLRQQVSELHLSVVPNPNNGNFLLSINEPERVRAIEVADMQGNIYLELSEVKASNPMIVRQSGLYHIIAFENDGTIVTTKFIILE